jgi:hypothetical protein
VVVPEIVFFWLFLVFSWLFLVWIWKQP